MHLSITEVSIPCYLALQLYYILMLTRVQSHRGPSYTSFYMIPGFLIKNIQSTPLKGVPPWTYDCYKRNGAKTEDKKSFELMEILKALY